MRAFLLIAVVLVLAGGAIWASGSSDRGLSLPGADASRGERGSAGSRRERAERRARRRARERRRAATPLPKSTCPDGLQGCRSVAGRVIYVESVDPDGDGDLHVVLSGRRGVSGPGITAVDIRPGLRWKRDPRVGDRVSAAGQVQTGSYGQAQIHAVEVHLRRAGDG